MIKAVFLDYTGTITQENCPAVQEVVMRCYKNSTMATPQEMLLYWNENQKKYENKSYLDSYITEDEIIDALLKQCADEIQLKDDFAKLHKLFQNFWMYSPVYDDARKFFEECKLPIYIVTNNGEKYVQEAMRVNHLHPAGIICGDMVRAYKPHRELFDQALKISTCSAREVLHVGDSKESDVMGAIEAGITPVYLDRTGRETMDSVKVAASLLEVLDLL